MIQREKEIRTLEALRFAEAAASSSVRISEEAERLEIEKQAKIERVLAQVLANIELIKDLKLPETLQGIIEEEHMESAHVFWSTQYYLHRPVPTDRYSRNISQNTDQVLVNGLYLAWDIVGTLPFDKPREEGEFGTAIPAIHEPVGFSAKYLEIMVSARKHLAIGNNNIPLHGHSNYTPPFNILYDNDLMNGTSREKWISSLYLDYPHPGSGVYMKTPFFTDSFPEVEAIRNNIATNLSLKLLHNNPFQKV